MEKRNMTKYSILLGIFMAVIPVNGLMAQLVNVNSTPETFKFKALLDSLYGKKLISGQVDESYLEYIQQTTGGKSPAIMGYDFNGICPSQGGNNDAAKAIKWVKEKNGIVQFQWHWISPNADGDWSSNKFNLATALSDTNSTSYKNMIRDLDLVAGEIKKMQNAGVPILWRPLHEAEGKWFWWGYSGGVACKSLYRLIYNRFVNKHKLNNIIWIWNSYGTTKENWYPGDDVVDIIAWDYPDYSASTGSWKQYQTLFGTKGKLFGIGEDGKLTDPNIFSSQPWLYFLTWAYMVKDPTQKDGKNTKDWLFKVYNDPRVLTLDDLTPGPKAYAGLSKTVFDFDADGIETVTLDGSASKTDSGTIVSYVWKENNVEIATGVNPSVSLGLGSHIITLTITTSTNATKSAKVSITVKSVSQSLQKTVKVSSTEAGFGNIAGNAVDGNEATRWSSVYSDPQWIQIDLGARYDIDQVILIWEVASAKNYRIDVSDNQTDWTTVRSMTNMGNSARKDSLKDLKGTGRYVRLYGTARNTSYGYSLWEFEVYGKLVSVSVGEDATLPSGFALEQNYPNPFNPATTIGYSIGKPGKVKITVANMLGQTIEELVNEYKDAGNYSVEFRGDKLSSGIYLYRIETQNYTNTKMMNLLK